MSTGLYAGLVEEVKRYGLNDTTPEEVFTSSLPVEYVVDNNATFHNAKVEDRPIRHISICRTRLVLE